MEQCERYRISFLSGVYREFSAVYAGIRDPEMRERSNGRYASSGKQVSVVVKDMNGADQRPDL